MSDTLPITMEAPQHPRQHGFTLLEMMLVVVLIGITVTFVNLDLQPDPVDLAQREGERVAALLVQLQEESILSGQVLAMEFDEFEQVYRFVSASKGNWRLIDNDDLFRSRAIKAPVKATLTVDATVTQNNENQEGEEEDDEPVPARIVVDPVGEITPFTFSLIVSGAKILLMLDPFGEIVVQREEET